MQVVIAGATGFVGRQVVREALDLGHQVFALVRAEQSKVLDLQTDPPGSLSILPWGADPETLMQGFNLPSGAWVVNAAGLPRERPGLDAGQIHESISRTIVELAEAVEAARLVHLSPLMCAVRDAFTRGKALAEAHVRGCAVPWSIVRSAPAYGPGDDLLDVLGAWMARSPGVPRFLERVPLQPLWVGNLATGLLRAQEGVQEVGGERLLWGELLEKCSRAAGKPWLGLRIPDSAVLGLARRFGHRSMFTDLIPFTEDGFTRHSLGYEVPANSLSALLGELPRALEDYLCAEWPYRDKQA